MFSKMLFLSLIISFLNFEVTFKATPAAASSVAYAIFLDMKTILGEKTNLTSIAPSTSIE